MKIRPYGEFALLVEPDDAAQVVALARALARDPRVVDASAGARSVLARVSPESGAAGALTALAGRLRQLGTEWTLADWEHPSPDDGHDEAQAATVVIDVRYDGPDLATTAHELGLTLDGLVRRHIEGDYVVAFCGFVPGFAYLRGLDAALHVSRLAEPRAHVPAGSVGIAGEFTGVYPRSSPGGWRLLGVTDEVLWDVGRTPPALLSPGAAVRFRAR